MSKYWLVYSGDDAGREAYCVFGSQLVIADTKQEALDIYIKLTNFKYDEDDFDSEDERNDEEKKQDQLDAHELEPMTIDMVNKQQKIQKYTK
ncbi:hypothetical protein CE11_01121 [Megavirus courdo11]|uniref:Uncharacterized protein n=2 Tax=Megavirus TaxID=3044761 RepID=K7YGF7_9VIRU|nr:hypothetical protein c7_L1241 [Megavirus courdo7]AFX93147.1 hypothetical protein CE11_01121 [Megavirus courdo11]AVL94315.1 hypothetical protein mvi_955 [Megavirus vitis]